MTWIVVALASVGLFTFYYRLSRRNGATRRSIAALVAFGFVLATPFLFAVAALAVTIKFAQLLLRPTV